MHRLNVFQRKDTLGGILLNHECTKRKIYNESKTINCLLINTILRESKNSGRLYTTISVQPFILVQVV